MMNHPQWQRIDASNVSLVGDLDRVTVPELWSGLVNFVPETETLTLSLERVGRIDSAGVALLVHAVEHAKKQNCHIMITFVSEQLRMLFQLSNIESMMAQHI